SGRVSRRFQKVGGYQVVRRLLQSGVVCYRGVTILLCMQGLENDASKRLHHSFARLSIHLRGTSFIIR
nr:hypothetical protein [Tanacetum cinerariifolium]